MRDRMYIATGTGTGGLQLDEEAATWESAFHLIVEDAARNGLLENTPFGGEVNGTPLASKEAREEALQEAQILSDNPQVTRAIATMNILDGMMAAFPAVQITGLSGWPELGEIGQVGPRVDDVTDRYPVTLASGKKLNVRVIICAPRAAAARAAGVARAAAAGRGRHEAATTRGGGDNAGGGGDSAGGGGDSAGGGGDDAGGGSPTTLGSMGLRRGRRPGRAASMAGATPSAPACAMSVAGCCRNRTGAASWRCSTCATIWWTRSPRRQVRRRRGGVALAPRGPTSRRCSPPKCTRIGTGAGGAGVYEMLCQWTADQPGVGAASRASEARAAGGAGGATTRGRQGSCWRPSQPPSRPRSARSRTERGVSMAAPPKDG